LWKVNDAMTRRIDHLGPEPVASETPEGSGADRKPRWEVVSPLGEIKGRYATWEDAEYELARRGPGHTIRSVDASPPPASPDVATLREAPEMLDGSPEPYPYAADAERWLVLESAKGRVPPEDIASLAALIARRVREATTDDVAKLRDALKTAREARDAWESAMMAGDYDAASVHMGELDAALAETETKEADCGE